MMDSPTQPTFIPHEAVTPVAVHRQSGGLAELMTLFSIIMLIVSGALGAGVFLYTQYLQTSNQSKLSQLQSAQSSFDPSLIQQLTRLNDRMNAAQTLLSQHLAPSQFFSVLQQSTVQDIAFSSLNYDATDPQHITISMTGVAGSVNSIALQAQIFSQSGIITSPIFSNIDAQADGVHFQFSALINPAAITYEGFVSAGQAGTQGTQQPAQPNGQQTQTQSQTQAPNSPFQGSATSVPATQSH